MKLNEKSSSSKQRNKNSVEKHIKRMRSPSKFHLLLENCRQERTIIPKAKDQSSHTRLCRTDVRSLNVSRHLIEEESPKPTNIQFSKKIKVDRRMHGRTQSNQVYNDGTD